MKKIIAIDKTSGECIHYCLPENLDNTLRHITENLNQQIMGEPLDVADNVLDFSKKPHEDYYVQPNLNEYIHYKNLRNY